MRGGLALDGRVGGEDHLGDAPGGDALDQLGNPQLLGADAVERRQRAAEHVVAPEERPGALHRPQIGHVLDDADRARGALRVGADAARVGGVEVAASCAGADVGGGLGQRLDQGRERGVTALQEMERYAPRRPGTQARQAREHLDQPFDIEHWQAARGVVLTFDSRSTQPSSPGLTRRSTARGCPAQGHGCPV